MPTTYNLVEGWTDPIDCILQADGAALNLTGLSVSLLAWNKALSPLTVAGSVSVTSAAAGTVRYSPTSGDALILHANSPVSVRWKLTDGSGKIRFIPNTDPDRWVVRQP